MALVCATMGSLRYNIGRIDGVVHTGVNGAINHESTVIIGVFAQGCGSLSQAIT